MCMRTHGTLKAVTETKQNNQISSQDFLYWLTNILIIFTFL